MKGSKETTNDRIARQSKRASVVNFINYFLFLHSKQQPRALAIDAPRRAGQRFN